MSKFDELKMLANGCRRLKWAPSGRNAIRTEEGDIVLGMGVEPDDDERMFIAAANPAAILELLDIQAQLVEALKNARVYVSHEGADDEVDELDAALAAAGAQP